MRSRAGIVLRAGALSLGLFAPEAAAAQPATEPPLAGADLLAALRAGGHILYFRHAYFALVGGQYLNEGEADVVHPRGTDFAVLARLGRKQWRDLATVPAQ